MLLDDPIATKLLKEAFSSEHEPLLNFVNSLLYFGDVTKTFKNSSYHTPYHIFAQWNLLITDRS